MATSLSARLIFQAFILLRADLFVCDFYHVYLKNFSV
jgi:hypothetical protein